jgi:pimeloyl-ACP methyl ester carboxylesterase
MDIKQFASLRTTITTPMGEIAYVEKGAGPAALFVHGVLLNGAVWRHVIDELAAERRCIAIDILGHGATRAQPGQDIGFNAQAAMLEAFCDAMGLEQVDLVANDSGGGFSQIFAALHPERIRTLTLTNCDTHDNYPPPALAGFVALAQNGQIAATIQRVFDEPEFGKQLLGTAYEHPEALSADAIDFYLRPWLATPQAAQDLERFLTGFDNNDNVRIEPQLQQLQAPALIVWGTADVFFDVKWAHWLKDTLPGATGVIEVPNAKLFFPEERPEMLAGHIRSFWKQHSRANAGVGAA